MNFRHPENLSIPTQWQQPAIGLIQQRKNGTYVFCNQTAAALFQTTPNLLLSNQSSLFDNCLLADGQLAEPGFDPAATTFNTGRPQPQQLVGKYNPITNRYDWLAIQCDPIFDPHNPSIVCEVMLSISLLPTSQKASTLPNGEDYFHQMIAAVEGYSIVLLNEQGIIQNWNKGAEKIKGYQQQEIIGKDFHVFYPPKAIAEGLPERLLQQAREQGTAYDEGWRIKKDGTLFWATVILTAVYDQQNQLIGFTKVTRDNSDKKKIEEQLIENEHRIQMALESVGDNAWEHNFANNTTYFSTKIQQLTGYTSNDLTDNVTNWWNNAHPSDRWMLEKNDQEYKAGTRSSHSIEYRIFHKDGSLKWVLDRGVVIERKPDGSPLKITGTHTDITGRKKSEKALKASEQLFRDLTQNVPGVIYQWHENTDGTYGFSFISPKLKEIFGLPADDMDLFVQLIHPADKERWRSSIEAANTQNDRWFFEGRLLYPDGSIKWWQGSSILSESSPEKKVYNGLIIDVTREKQIEAALKQEQQRFESIFNSTFQFIGFLSPAGILLIANETALHFAQLSADDVIGKPFWECHWCLLQQSFFKDAVQTAMEGHFFRGNVEIYGIGEQTAWIDFSIKPIFDEQGAVKFLIPEGRDITEQLKLQSLNKEQEEQLALFVKHTPAAVAMLDTHLKYLIASDRWYTDYQIAHPNIIGKSHQEVFPDMVQMPAWINIQQQCLQGASLVQQEDEMITADGKKEWIKWEIHPWKKYDGSIGGLILFTEIITDSILARENLTRLNQQLTASNTELEQFAYVASHDLQEPLRMVGSFLHLLKVQYGQQLDERAHQYISFAIDGANRMKLLIRDLLNFSRIGTQKTQSDLVPLATVAARVIRMLHGLIEEHQATIRIANLPAVEGSASQLDQLFQNLISNGIKYRSEKPPEISIGCELTDNYWKFSIQDNGMGIKPDYHDKIFEIFQRLHNKRDIPGTGIGLAICKKIVENHGGQMWVHSQENEGSIFYFTLPKKN